MSQISDAFISAIHVVSEMRRAAGELPVQLYVVFPGDEGLFLVIPEDLPSADERGRFMVFLRDHYCAHAVGMISEAWVSRRNTLEGPMPSADPSSEESIMATLFEGDSAPRVWAAKIHSDGKVDDPEEMPGTEIKGTLREVYESETSILEA